MKRVWRRLVVVGLLIAVSVSVPCILLVGGAETDELDYENYVAVTVHPDGSIIMTLQGSHVESLSPWERSTLQELGMTLDVTVEDEDVTQIESEVRVVLDPSDYAELANLELDLEGRSGETRTNLTALVDYPGYLGVNASLGFVVVEPPHGFVLDAMVEAKLYYTFYSREELQVIMGMLPLLETQLAAQVAAASDGHISLETLELLDYEEEPDHAALTVGLRLSGDLQEGILSALEGVGAELAPPEEAEGVSPLSVESVDYHVTFNGAALSLEADIGGALSGDFNGQLNVYKDASLEELLESDEIEDEDKTLIARALPIDIHVQHLLIESISSFGEDSATSTFSVEGLGLKPPSFEALMAFLEELSRKEPLEGFKLVLVGESSGNQYVVFTVPEESTEPIHVEEGMVVWEMDDIGGLEDVTYEVETRGLNTTTLVAASAVGLAVIGVAVFFLRK